MPNANRDKPFQLYFFTPTEYDLQPISHHHLSGNITHIREAGNTRRNKTQKMHTSKLEQDNQRRQFLVAKKGSQWKPATVRVQDEWKKSSSKQECKQAAPLWNDYERAKAKTASSSGSGGKTLSEGKQPLEIHRARKKTKLPFRQKETRARVKDQNNK